MKDSAKNIRLLSRILKYLFLSAAFALPIITAGAWISDGYSFLKPWVEWNIYPEISQATIKPLNEMAASTKLLGFLASLIPVAFQTVALALLQNYLAFTNVLSSSQKRVSRALENLASAFS